MARGRAAIREMYLRSLGESSMEEIEKRMLPHDDPILPKVPGGSIIDERTLGKRWQLIDYIGRGKEDLLGLLDEERAQLYSKNIENFIGVVTVPLGLAGPLRVNGLHAKGDFYLPLATTEAALVASFHRGACLISASGGCSAIVLSEGVCRSPGFTFETLAQAAQFVVWCESHFDELQAIAHATTRFGKLFEMRASLEGNHAYLIFEFSTADAAGQNMVTIATHAVCQYILDKCPFQPKQYFIEANHSGDKKASAQSFLSVRGKKVVAEVKIPRTLVEKYLHCTPEIMADYWRLAAIGGILSGTIGIHGHYANGLAAIYLACGQDIACVAESAVGVTRIELAGDGDLYASVTLPNLIVGTVGGGTGLPSQKACLQIMHLDGEDCAEKFAEVCAGLVLAGELSIQGAICADHFARAHQNLARGKKLVEKTQTDFPNNP